jgi:hypothetical protein
VTVTVLHFQAGPNRYALAAGTVAAIASARADLPHLADLLGETSGPVDARRALRLSARGRAVELVVDGPVELVQLNAGDVSPSPVTSRVGVLGFARVSGGLTVLLDAPVLVDRVLEYLGSGDDAR